MSAIAPSAITLGRNGALQPIFAVEMLSNASACQSHIMTPKRLTAVWLRVDERPGARFFATADHDFNQEGRILCQSIFKGRP